VSGVYSRARAEELDARDPLAGFRASFAMPDPDLIYLDGNSLGRMPAATPGKLNDALHREWADRLIRSWNETWFDLPSRVGDLIGSHFLGAAPGQVVVADSTTVNFYKLVAAAVAARPGRGTIITDRANFPTDRYVVEGVAAAGGLTATLAEFDEIDGPTPSAVAAAVSPDTALVTLSLVDYRSGALADMAAINEVVHAAGALVLWDLSHAAGAVPVDLDGTGTDLAVGCTYKYLNGGPGAPAFLYVRSDLVAELMPPIWGWYGQHDQFAMGQGFQPVPGPGRFLSGTPHVLGAIAAEEGTRLMAQAGIGRLREKSIRLTELAIELADAWLVPYGCVLASPRDAGGRGSHISLSHPDGYRICRALIELGGVIPDFRQPDRLRLGLAPAYTRFTDVWDGLDRLRTILADGSYLTIDLPDLPVT
jgi:kynureninase